jgi:hypothetical protein
MEKVRTSKKKGDHDIEKREKGKEEEESLFEKRETRHAITSKGNQQNSV